MDFAFSEEQQLFRQTVRDFATNVLLKKYTYWDKTRQWPAEMSRKMGELGLTGLRLPEKYGGTPADYVTLGIASEEISRGDFSCTTIMSANQITGQLLAQNASETIKDRYLPSMARGLLTIATSMTEPHCGSDVVAMTTRAVRESDHYVVTGEKSSTTMASEVPALVLWAKTDPTAGARGISAFVIPTDAEGLSISSFNDLGLKSLKRGAVHLDNVRVPTENMVGKEGRGLHLMLNQFDYNRALLGLQCIGATDQTVQETIAYVKSRHAFGRPVASYQGVAFPIVEALTRIEAARLLCYRVLWLRDHDLPHAKEAHMVKWWVPLTCFETVHQLLLCYGHAGYGDDYPVGQRLRDLLSWQIGDGTAQIMKLAIAREMFGREFAP